MAKASKTAAPMADLIAKAEAATLAAQRSKGPKCVVCELPRECRDFIRRMRTHTPQHPPKSFPAISAGLAAIGYKVQDERISYHLRKEHPE